VVGYPETSKPSIVDKSLLKVYQACCLGCYSF